MTPTGKMRSNPCQWLSAATALLCLSAGPAGAVEPPPAETIRAAAPMPVQSGRVRAILDQNGEPQELAARSRLARSLYGSQIAASEREALFKQIVLQPMPQDVDVREWAPLFNDVLNLLNQQTEPPKNYAKNLLELIANAEREPLLRDYALQHVQTHAKSRPPEACLELLTRAQAIAVKSPQTTLPGTWLHGICDRAGQAGFPEVGDVCEAALALAMEPETPLPNRITGLQVCAQLRHHEALPLAVEIAEDQEAALSLRTAAIYTIGQLGGEDHAHKKRLTKLKRWGHPRLQFAASQALKSI